MMEQACQIWNTPAEVTVVKSDPHLMFVTSRRTGGSYQILSVVAELTKTLSIQDKLKLTTWLVDQRRFGTTIPTITKDIISSVPAWRRMDVGERAIRALQFISKKIIHLGQRIDLSTFYDEMLPVTESMDRDEVVFMKDYLSEKGWLQKKSPETPHMVTISIQGYSYLDSWASAGAGSSQAFVAMWFHSSMDLAYKDGLAAAIQDAGYKPLRIDKKEHSDKIDDEIISEIRRSRFLVADYTFGGTGVRGGVYYEAGFARGLNIPVIPTCREDLINDIHFDTRQYNHVTWSSPDELRRKLRARITAQLGEGPFVPAVGRIEQLHVVG